MAAMTREQRGGAAGVVGCIVALLVIASALNVCRIEPVLAVFLCAGIGAVAVRLVRVAFERN